MISTALAASLAQSIASITTGQTPVTGPEWGTCQRCRQNFSTDLLCDLDGFTYCLVCKSAVAREEIMDFAKAFTQTFPPHFDTETQTGEVPHIREFEQWLEQNGYSLAVFAGPGDGAIWRNGQRGILIDLRPSGEYTMHPASDIAARTQLFYEAAQERVMDGFVDAGEDGE